jgi:hypothetical protein
MDQEYDARVTGLLANHSSESDKLYRSFHARAMAHAQRQKEKIAALQRALNAAGTRAEKMTTGTAKKLQKFCGDCQSKVLLLSQQIRGSTSLFDAETATIFEDFKGAAQIPLPRAPLDFPASFVRLNSLRKQAAELKRLRAELDSAFLTDLLQTELHSLQLFNSVDVVQTKETFLAELRLLSSCLVRTNGLSDAISEVNFLLARFQRKRFDIAQDRIDYEQLWNSIFWEELDAIQHAQLELNVNTFFYLKAKLTRLDQENPRTTPSVDDSESIERIKHRIAALQKQIQRDQIAFQAEYQSRRSEYIVGLQELETVNRQELQQLRDQRDGLLGMHNERIEVLIRGISPASPTRERHLADVARELSDRLARLKGSRRGAL